MPTASFSSSGTLTLSAVGASLLYPNGSPVSMGNLDVRLLAQKPGNVPISMDNLHGRSVFSSIGDSGNSGIFTGFSSALACGTINDYTITASAVLVEVGNISSNNTCRFTVSGHHDASLFYAVAVSNGGFYTYTFAQNATVQLDFVTPNTTTYSWNGAFTGMSIAVPFYVFVFM